MKEGYVEHASQGWGAQVFLSHLLLSALNAWKISSTFIQQTEISAVMFVNKQDEHLRLKILEQREKEKGRIMGRVMESPCHNYFLNWAGKCLIFIN